MECNILIENIITYQNKYIYELYPDIISNNDIDLIIEIGTASGGLPIFLRNTCKFKNKIITYDIRNVLDTSTKELFDNLNIDFRQKDVFKFLPEIISLIKSNKQVLILCDGGNKIEEFNTFSKYLKHKDIILVHDFSQDLNEFNKNIKGEYWDYCEVIFEQIKSSCSTYGITQIIKDIYTKSVTFVGVKNL